MAKFLVRTSSESGIQGPFSGQELEQLARTAELQPQYLVSNDAGTSWQDAIRFFRRYGSAEQLRNFLESGVRTLELCPWDGLSDEEGEQFQDGFRMIGPRVRELCDRATEIEHQLQLSGLEYDSETQRLREIEGKRGRKQYFFAKCVREAYRRNHEGMGNTQELRDRIATELGHIFHPSLNDPRYRGSIWNALNTHLNPERHY